MLPVSCVNSAVDMLSLSSEEDMCHDSFHEVSLDAIVIDNLPVPVPKDVGSASIFDENDVLHQSTPVSTDSIQLNSGNNLIFSILHMEKGTVIHVPVTVLLGNVRVCINLMTSSSRSSLVAWQQFCLILRLWFLMITGVYFSVLPTDLILLIAMTCHLMIVVNTGLLMTRFINLKWMK